MADKTMPAAVRVGRARPLAFLVLALMVAALVGVFWATTAPAATIFTVNSTDDDPASGATSDGVCTTATAGECTLRAAIQEANGTAGVDTVEFAISGAGPHTISPASELPAITETVIIDGYTQGDATAVTDDDAKENNLAVGNNAVLRIVLDGTNAGANASGLRLSTSDSTIKGLVIYNWDNNGSGVFLDTGAKRNKVQGNYIGTDASGTQPLGNTTGVVISSSPDSIIGGTTATARNVISANSTFGIRISSSGAMHNTVQGNYIGTNATGTEALGNDIDGVRIQVDADDNTIGGTTARAGNIISGNGGDGVQVRYNSPASTPNNPDPDPATGNRILSNSIYDNAELGIDLVHSNNATEEATCNDLADNDDGPNHLQNYPVITSAKLTTKRIGGHRRKVTIIKGTLNSDDGKIYNLQFFGSPEADPPSGPPPCGPASFGEGKTFLGQKSVKTDPSGDAFFTFTSKKKVPKGQVVTATATNNMIGDPSEGDTSEFSQAVTVT